MSEDAVAGTSHVASYVDTRARPDSLGATGLVFVAIAGAAWTTAVSGVAIWRHNQFLSHRYDLGNVVQAVWSTTQGRPLEMTDGTTGDQIVRLAAHVDPILVLFAPIWWIHPAPETLIIGYVGVIAAGVYPVVRLAFKYTGSRWMCGLLGSWYLVLPWTIWIALNESNPVGLTLSLLLYAIWYLDEHRLRPFAVAATLAMLSGELIGLAVGGLGIWYAIRYRRVSRGILIAAAGAAWTVISVALVIPAFNDGQPSRYYEHFESVGGSPAGVLETTFTDPGTVVGELMTASDVQYVILLALPTAFLFLGAPLLLLMAVPQLGANLLSGYGGSLDPWSHHSAVVVAALVGASTMAVGRLPARLRVVGGGVALVVSVALLIALPPRPGADGYLFADVESSSRVAAMRHAVGLVPAAAPVTVTNRLGAHLSARRTVHLFPARTDAQWAVLDTRDPSNRASWIGPISFERRLRDLERSPRWHSVFSSEGIRVFRKKSGLPKRTDSD